MKLKQFLLLAALGLTASAMFTSCEDILGEWSRPALVTPGTTPTPASYVMAADATAEDKGKLICTDGHIHADGEDADCTKARVAMIVYLGTTGHATYSHGLALALADEGQMNWETAKTRCSGKNASTSTPVTDATWLLASKDQWNYMINAAGDYTALCDGFSGITGASNLQSNNYWSSTESASDRAWNYSFFMDLWGNGLKSLDDIYVRACLAF